MKKFRKTNEVDDLDLDNLEFEEEIIEIDEQSGVPLYGAKGVYGVIIVNTKK